MNIQQLKYFVEVCRCGSFSKEAENLFISPQGVSMAILRLESELSVKMFIRTPKGLTMTSDGEFMLEHAQNILNEYAVCENYFNRNELQETAVNVAGVQGVISEFADQLSGFQDTYQQYKLFLREYTDRTCDQMIEDGEAEVGLGLEPLDQDKFDCCPLYSKRLVLLVHKTHPYAQRKCIPTRLLQDLPMVMVDEKLKSADYFLDLCKKQDVRPNVLYRVGEVVAVHRIVGRNKCAGLSVESVSDALQTPDLVAIPFEDENFLWTVDLFKRKGEELSAGARLFWEFIQQKLSEERQN